MGTGAVYVGVMGSRPVRSAQTKGTRAHCSSAYSTATQHASFPPRSPCARSAAGVAKPASHAGHACGPGGADALLWLELCERERFELWEDCIYARLAMP